MKEVSESVMLEAIKFAHQEIKKHCQVQNELMPMPARLTKKGHTVPRRNDDDLRKAVEAFCYGPLLRASPDRAKDKHARTDAFDALKARVYGNHSRRRTRS
jgi:polyribonucleotide nucleotidyltransferase